MIAAPDKASVVARLTCWLVFCQPDVAFACRPVAVVTGAVTSMFT